MFVCRLPSIWNVHARTSSAVTTNRRGVPEMMPTVMYWKVLVFLEQNKLRCAGKRAVSWFLKAEEDVDLLGLPLGPSAVLALALEPNWVSSHCFPT